MKKKNQKSTRQQQAILPIILWLVPLIAANIGFYFLSHIDFYWRSVAQSEKAFQETESLASGANFEYQFAKKGEELRKSLANLIESEIDAKKLPSFLKTRADRIFREPFPQKELYVFKIAPKSSKTELVLNISPPIVSTYALKNTFKYLVDCGENKKFSDAIRKTKENILISLFGRGTTGKVYSTTQRARTTYAFYKVFPHRLVWDYFKIPGKGIFGYFLLSKCVDENRTQGMLLSLRDFKERKKGLAAFIPLHKGFGGAVFQAPLNRSKIFRRWVSHNVPLADKNLKHWLTKGPPDPQKIGNFKVFSYVGLSSPHLTTLLVPCVKPVEFPKWLFTFNLLLGGIVALALLRGFFLGHWPSFKLKQRFFIMFILSATLPISLLVIASAGYINQFRQAIHYQTISNLLTSIKQFDLRKSQLTEDYRNSFSKLIKNPEFVNCLKTEGSKSQNAKEIIQDSFINRKPELPLSCFAIFDEVAEGLRGYGQKNTKDLDAFVDSFSYPIVKFLRGLILKKTPEAQLREYDPPDKLKLAVEAYNSMTNLDLVEKTGLRRSFVITRQRGYGIASQIHDYVKIDGTERFAVLISWEDQLLDEQTIKQTANYLTLNQPDFDFLYFEATPQGVKYFQTPNRHISQQAKTLARKLAENVYFKGSQSSLRSDDFSLVAYPCQNYTNKIIVGIASNHNTKKAVWWRKIILNSIIVLTILVVIICTLLVIRLTINPLNSMKKSLDQVGRGNFDTEIKIGSNDELQLLGNEFKTMARGIKERNQLATLLSDQAIEALSQNQNADGILEGESFEAVVFISDIRNFTGMCETYPPDDITNLLNDHFAALTKAITNQKGRIYKFIGDAVEAVFPIDPGQKDGPEVRAFKAAYAAIQEIENLNHERTQKKLFNYKFGIGLAFGKLYSGGVGSLETRLDYAVVGKAFAKANKLEALSVKNPEFPVTTDRRIKDFLVQKQVIFEALDEEADSFIVKEITCRENFEESRDVEEKETQQKNSLIIEDKHSNDSLKIPLWGWKLITIIFIAAFLSANIFAFRFKEAAVFNAWLTEKKVQLFRLAEQITSQSGPKTGFGSLCQKKLNTLQKNLQFSPQKDEAEKLKLEIENMLAELKSQKINFSKFMTVYFPEKLTAKNQTAKTLYNLGWNQQQAAILKRFALYKLNNDLHGSDKEKDELTEALQKAFGERITTSILCSAEFSKPTKISLSHDDELLFSTYLTAQKPERTDKDISKKPSELRNELPPNNVRFIGMVFISIKEENINSPIFAEAFSDKNNHIAIIEPGSSIHFSDSFPENVRSYVTKEETKIPEKAGISYSDWLSLNNKKVKFVIFSEIQGKTVTNVIHYLYIILCFIFILALIFELFKNYKILDHSLAAKFWFAFFLSSLLPISTVFFVSDLYYIENLNAQISQEKADLQKFMETFELRQSFTEPMAWRFMELMAYSNELGEITEKIDNMPPESRNFQPLVEYFNTQHKKIANLNLVNFTMNTVAMASKGGFEYTNSGFTKKKYKPIKDETNIPTEKKFAFLLAKIAKNLISKLRQETPGDSFDAEAFVGEEALQIAVETVRTMFGDEVAVRMINSVGLPSRMSLLDSIAGLVLFPVKQLIKPDFVMLFLIMFNNNGYLDRIAQYLDNDYAIFPIESLATYKYATPVKNPYNLDLVKLTNWVWNSKLPVSGEQEIDGHKFIFLSRNGIHQTTMVLTGFKPIDPIINAANRTNMTFLLGLLLSIMLITILAKNVANEVLLPVKSLTSGMKEIGAGNLSARIFTDRKDELGDLCDSFNMMARGLEEKLVMGKMVSSSAMQSITQDYSSHKEKVVILYAVSPGFSNWINMTKPADLFSDLQIQVAEINRILIDANGEIDKVMGEKILAVFKGNIKDAAINAVKAALNLVEAEQRGLLPFPVAIGINTGVVIAGSLGVGNKRDFTVIGDPVNVSARIASQAEELRFFRVLVSEEISELTHDSYGSRNYGEVELKGKSELLTVFQLEPK